VSDNPILLMSVHAGPSIYVSELDRRAQAFAMGVSLGIATGLRHPATAYLFSVYALTAQEEDIRAPCTEIAKQLSHMRPTSWLTSSTWVVTSACEYVSSEI
jgi:hypothetical protein